MNGNPSPRFSLRTAMFAVLLAALVISVAIQGSLLILQGRRITSLEATARQLQTQNIQRANVFMRDQQARIGEFSDLRREIEAIRGASLVPATTKSSGVASSSSRTPEGEWVQVTVERGGNLVNSGVRAADVHLFVHGDAFRSEVDGKVVSQWTIHFDPNKNPPEFNATIGKWQIQGAGV